MDYQQMNYPWADPMYCAWVADEQGKTKYLGSLPMSEMKKYIDEKYKGFWINKIIKVCNDGREIYIIEQNVEILEETTK